MTQTSGDDDLSKAVLCTCDSSVAPEVRRQATSYIEAVRDHPDGWKFCLEKLFSGGAVRGEVRFVCASIVHHAVATRRPLPAEDVELLRRALISWPTTFLQNSATATGCDAPVRNKVAQALVHFFKNYRAPVEWPELADTLLAAASANEAALDFALRTLIVFSEETVDRQPPTQFDREAATAIKDTLRVRSNAQLVQFCFAVLTTFAESRPALALMALSVVRSFTSWINIALVANDQFLPLLFRLLTHPTFASEACDCVLEVISKGMDPPSKVELINQLHLPSVVSASASAISADSNLALKLCKLVTLAALELLLACDKMQLPQAAAQADKARSAASMIDELVPFLVSFLNHDDREVSDATYSFLHPFVTQFKGSAVGPAFLSPPFLPHAFAQNKKGTSPQLKPGDLRPEHAQLLLPVLLRRVTYPPDFFQSRRVSEEEEAFEEYRKKIGYLFKALVRLAPEIVASFVHTALATVSGQQSANWWEAEAALTLFFMIGEGVGNVSSQHSVTEARGLATSPAISPCVSPIPTILDGPVQQSMSMLLLNSSSPDPLTPLDNFLSHSLSPLLQGSRITNTRRSC